MSSFVFLRQLSTHLRTKVAFGLCCLPIKRFVIAENEVFFHLRTFETLLKNKNKYSHWEMCITKLKTIKTQTVSIKENQKVFIIEPFTVLFTHERIIHKLEN